MQQPHIQVYSVLYNNGKAVASVNMLYSSIHVHTGTLKYIPSPDIGSSPAFTLIESSSTVLFYYHLFLSLLLLSFSSLPFLSCFLFNLLFVSLGAVFAYPISIDLPALAPLLACIHFLSRRLEPEFFPINHLFFFFTLAIPNFVICHSLIISQTLGPI